jgi:DNA invertase Pin-like site-specific DNA recombinase
VYAAKSTEDRRGSIPDQLRECRAAIEAEPGRSVVAEYSDEAVSAFTRSRGPGLDDAMRHAEELARDGGVAELWALHSDRLARGDGRAARHAVEIALWALKQDVAVKTVQDPDTFRDLLYAVVTGQRNNEDSRRKGLASAAGRRRAVERGEYTGAKPDGYMRVVEVDDAGQVKRRLDVDPARRPLVELMFAMALRGKGTAAIETWPQPEIDGLVLHRPRPPDLPHGAAAFRELDQSPEARRPEAGCSRQPVSASPVPRPSVTTPAAGLAPHVSGDLA